MTKEVQMRAAVADFNNQGGVNKLAYCQRMGIKTHTFKYWWYKIADEAKPKGFLPVKTTTAIPRSSPSLEIVYPNGVKIMVAGDSQAEYLGRLIHLY